MSAIKPVCKAQKVRKDGTIKVYLQYCLTSDKRTLLETDIVIPLRYWNKKRSVIMEDLPEKYGNASELNDGIKRQLRNAEDVVDILLKRKVTDKLVFLKQHYKPLIKPEAIGEIIAAAEKENSDARVVKQSFFFSQIDDYIKTKLRKVSKDMSRIYRNMKSHLLEFEHFRNKLITFETLDINFYNELVEFLSFDYVLKNRRRKKTGLKVNSVGKTIKQLLTFLNDRVEKKIIAPVSTSGWKILEEEVDAIYLNNAEIKKIYNADLKEFPHLEEYRNDFLLGCLTALRFSDLTKLSEGDVRGNMLHKKQKKSHHWVVIPLLRQAQQILRERFEKNLPSPTNAEFNRHIKNLGRIAGIINPVCHSYKKQGKMIEETKPKYAWITSHTCRRSFCTNEFLAGTPVELIMKISGHKSLKDFYKYIRISPEEAANKILEIWKGRENATT